MFLCSSLSLSLSLSLPLFILLFSLTSSPSLSTTSHFAQLSPPFSSSLHPPLLLFLFLSASPSPSLSLPLGTPLSFSVSCFFMPSLSSFPFSHVAPCILDLCACMYVCVYVCVCVCACILGG